MRPSQSRTSTVTLSTVLSKVVSDSPTQRIVSVNEAPRTRSVIPKLPTRLPMEYMDLAPIVPEAGYHPVGVHWRLVRPHLLWLVCHSFLLTHSQLNRNQMSLLNVKLGLAPQMRHHSRRSPNRSQARSLTHNHNHNHNTKNNSRYYFISLCSGIHRIKSFGVTRHQKQTKKKLHFHWHYPQKIEFHRIFRLVSCIDSTVPFIVVIIVIIVIVIIRNR